MGLAASQVRLLSLTSRQHSVESEAQRLQNFKLQLANNSDAVYQTYLNALDATILQTQQTDAYGDTSWISGSIINLMRYNASEDTSGDIFYVQDVETGKLYVTEELGAAYDSVTASGDAEADGRSFAELFGITYELKDYNEDILINYQKALDNGWDTLMDETLLEEYTTACANDAYIQNLAAGVLTYIPEVDDDGLYQVDEGSSSGSNIVTALEKVINSGTYYDDVYSDEEKAVIEGAYNLLSMLTELYEDLYDSDNWADSSYSFLGVETDTTYTIDSTAGDGTTDYVYSEDSTYDANDILEMMLNGGTATLIANETTTVTTNKSGTTYTYNTYTASADIYTYDSSTGTTSEDILSAYGASTYGEALTEIFTRVASSTSYVETFLSDNGLTADDVANYKTYLKYLNDYSSYSPSYYYVPSDSVQAAWYEQLYAAITAAGGYITVSDSQAKNASWVTNMVKNTQAALVTYDSDEGTLSRTSASLNTSLKEVTDDSAIEEADAEYEYEMELINNKDSQYDTRLEMLETERSAISTEIDSLESVIDENVEKVFKVMG